jgi:hypothetical protein
MRLPLQKLGNDHSFSERQIQDSQFEVGTEFPHIEIPHDAFESAEGKLGELFKLRNESDS